MQISKSLFIGYDHSRVLELVVGLSEEFSLDYHIVAYEPSIRDEWERRKRAKEIVERVSYATKYRMCYYYSCTPEQLLDHIVQEWDSKDLWEMSADEYIELSGINIGLEGMNYAYRFTDNAVYFGTEFYALVEKVRKRFTKEISRAQLGALFREMDSLKSDSYRLMGDFLKKQLLIDSTFIKDTIKDMLVTVEPTKSPTKEFIKDISNTMGRDCSKCLHTVEEKAFILKEGWHYFKAHSKYIYFHISKHEGYYYIVDIETRDTLKKESDGSEKTKKETI